MLGTVYIRRSLCIHCLEAVPGETHHEATYITAWDDCILNRIVLRHAFSMKLKRSCCHYVTYTSIYIMVCRRSSCGLWVFNVVIQKIWMLLENEGNFLFQALFVTTFVSLTHFTLNQGIESCWPNWSRGKDNHQKELFMFSALYYKILWEIVAEKLVRSIGKKLHHGYTP